MKFSRGVTMRKSALVLFATTLTTTAILNGAMAADLDFSPEKQIRPCVTGEETKPRVLVDVSGIQSSEGNLRVQIYNDNPEDFLVSGKKVLRVDVPSHENNMKVCVVFPVEGTYSMAVMHDKNANGRADIFTEGFGFSNNPELGFGPPEHEETLFQVSDGVREMNIDLTYYFQLENKDSKRRRRR